MWCKSPMSGSCSNQPKWRCDSVEKNTTGAKFCCKTRIYTVKESKFNPQVVVHFVHVFDSIEKCPVVLIPAQKIALQTFFFVTVLCALKATFVPQIQTGWISASMQFDNHYYFLSAQPCEYLSGQFTYEYEDSTSQQSDFYIHWMVYF